MDLILFFIGDMDTDNQWGCITSNQGVDTPFPIKLNTLYIISFTVEAYSNSYYGISGKSTTDFKFTRPGGGGGTVNFIVIGK